MASSLIGNLAAYLTLNTAQFEAGARKAETRARGLKGSLQGAFGGIKESFGGLAKGLAVGLVAGGVEELVRHSFEVAAELKEAAERAGVATEKLQGLRRAATDAGVSNETLEKALGKMSRTLGEISEGRGAEKFAKFFADTGLTIEKLKGQKPDVQLGLIADALNKIPDAATRAAAGQTVFGRGFQQLIPLISQGSKGLADYQAAQERAGVITDAQADKLDRAADAYTRLKNDIQTQVALMVVNLIDADKKFTEFNDGLQEVRNAIIGAFKAIPGAVGSAVAKVGAVLGNFVSLGRDIVAGIARGILANAASVWEALERVALGGVEAVKRRLGIKSPSLVFAELGFAVSSGFASGILAKQAEVENAIRKVAKASIDAIGALDIEVLNENALKGIERALAPAKAVFEDLSRAGQRALDGLGDALTDVITGARSVKDAFADLAKSIIRDLIRISIQALVIRPLLSALGLNFAGGFASGGTVTAGRTILVGERGPELFTPRTSGTIIPNHALAGSDRFTINQTIAPNFAGNAATKDDLIRMGVIAKQSAVQAINESRRRAA